MEELRKKELQMNIYKAKANVAEKEYRIIEKQADITRLELAKTKQEELIETYETELQGE